MKKVAYILLYVALAYLFAVYIWYAGVQILELISGVFS